MKKIMILGAFDRYNYGDLLFPIILKQVLTERLDKYEYEIEYYSTTKVDLTNVGGVVTKSLSELEYENFDNNSIIIISGGEVLAATWSAMHSNLIKNQFIRLGIKISRKVLGRRIVDNFSRNDLKSKLILPWVLSPNQFQKKVKVIYNAVGGRKVCDFPSYYKKHVAESINEATYFSVRDSEVIESIQSLKGINQNIDLYPDSAISMSYYFPKAKLKTLISNNSRDCLEKLNSNYIVFQTNFWVSKGFEDQIAYQLDELNRSTGLNILLLPIGRAYDHDDKIILKKIHSKMKTNSAVLLEEGNIFDTMYLIANSKVYLGTSLHGAITALSFSVPHFALTNEVKKLISFIESWEPEKVKVYLNFDEINTLDKYISDELSNVNKIRDELVDKAEENFNNIINHL